MCTVAVSHDIHKWHNDAVTRARRAEVLRQTSRVLSPISDVQKAPSLQDVCQSREYNIPQIWITL
jgi:hypothetical protein